MSGFAMLCGLVINEVGSEPNFVGRFDVYSSFMREFRMSGCEYTDGGIL